MATAAERTAELDAQGRMDDCALFGHDWRAVAEDLVFVECTECPAIEFRRAVECWGDEVADR